ncbi:reverse transcriptase [Gossypium australe]|uniref:Reverse transcriptase n=1 Tax=Gossypium australe TaxID=47621 RepID=A0A5B6W7T0_9ROSI|nr:reverse transcriptase [Gossypium australe]
MAALNGQIRGGRVVQVAPQITHLLLADDNLIFGEATTMGADMLKRILQQYARCSGQLINFAKSSVFFSTNVKEGNQSDFVCILGVVHMGIRKWLLRILGIEYEAEFFLGVHKLFQWEVGKLNQHMQWCAFFCPSRFAKRLKLNGSILVVEVY